MAEPVKLEKNLILNQFILKKLGFSDYNKLLGIFKGVEEGFNEEGRSYFLEALKLQEEVLISHDKLNAYDYNIKDYLKQINIKKNHEIKLKYFQYLAILLSEIYLDNYFNNPIKLLSELKNFIMKNFDGNIEFLYGRDDLSKLAYWMATGSGKTFIFHINYLQILHYNKGINKINFDNIILITPSILMK